MEVTGKGLVFTGAIGSFLKISNSTGMLTIGKGNKSVELDTDNGGGLNISMDYGAYFRLGHGKDRNTDIPLIEARYNYVKIGTERNYIKFDSNGAYVIVNGITKKL